MIKAQEIIGVLRAQQATLSAQFSVQKIGLFGSFARDEAKPDSDVDILVDLATPTFDHYMDLKFFLEDLLHVSVDLVPSEALKPRLRPYVMREVIYA